MSFIQSTRKCKKCGHEINVAAGVVGNQVMGDGGPADCPVCHGALETISQGWNATNPTPPTEDRDWKTERKFVEKFSDRFSEIARLADGWNYEGYGKNLARLEIDIKDFISQVEATAEARGRKEMLERVKKELNNLMFYDEISFDDIEDHLQALQDEKN